MANFKSCPFQQRYICDHSLNTFRFNSCQGVQVVYVLKIFLDYKQALVSNCWSEGKTNLLKGNRILRNSGYIQICV